MKKIKFFVNLCLALLFLSLFLSNAGALKTGNLKDTLEKRTILIDSCQNLYSNNNYILTDNVYSDDTCFNILGDNVILNCDNYNISYSCLGESDDPNNQARGCYALNNLNGYDNLHIRNCRINYLGGTSPGFSIALEDSNNSVIENNALWGGKAGILVISSPGTRIENNRGYYFEYGHAEWWDVCDPFNTTMYYKYFESAIWLIDSENCNIENNFIQGDETEWGITNHFGTESGITLCRSNNNSIVRNRINSVDTYGIHISNSSKNYVSLNEVNGSGLPPFSNTNDGIILDRSNNNYLNSNHFYRCSEWGIFLTNSNNNLIWDNDVALNDMVGIRAGGTSAYNHIIDNSVYDNSQGIRVEGHSNVVEENLVENNSYGILVATPFYFGNNFNASNNTIINNQVREQTHSGVLLLGAEGNEVRDNLISSNEVGIEFKNSLNNTASNNLIENNYYGIYFYAADLPFLGPSCKENIVKDSIIYSEEYGVVSETEARRRANNTLLNVSLDKNKIFVISDQLARKSENAVYFKWYVDVYVNQSQNSFTNSPTIVRAYDRFNNLSFVEILEDSGYIPRQLVTEFYQIPSGQTFLNNYSIKAIKGRDGVKIDNVNVSGNLIGANQIVLDFTQPSIGKKK